MVFRLPTRVLETASATVGTGNYILGGAVTGYRTVAGSAPQLSNGDTSFFFVAGGSFVDGVFVPSGDYEFGRYTYSGGEVARTSIRGSSNGGAAVSWLAGPKLIGIGPLGPSDMDATALAAYLESLGISTFIQTLINDADAPTARQTLGAIDRGFRNLLHNGGFQVAQRGDGPFTSASTFVNNDDSYLLDGCIFLANGSDTCDVSRVADTDFVSGRKIRLDVETNNRRFGVLFPIESANIQAIRKSGKASVQFKVKRTGTTLTNVRAYLLAWSSTADAITSDVISAWGSADGDPTFVANWTAENAGANLAVGTTIATHRIENITVDTASITNLALLIISNPTTTTVGDFLDIGDVQVEEGANATEYEHRPIAVDLALSQRYFYSRDGYYILAYAATSGVGGQHFPHPVVPMRAAPTISMSGGTPANCSGLTANASAGGARIYTTITTAGTGAYDNFTVTASAEL